MNDTVKHTPRLGSASMLVSISDAEGLTVKHGTDGDLLAYRPPELCSDEWEQLWKLISKITTTNRG